MNTKKNNLITVTAYFLFKMLGLFVFVQDVSPYEGCNPLGTRPCYDAESTSQLRRVPSGNAMRRQAAVNDYLKYTT